MKEIEDLQVFFKKGKQNLENSSNGLIRKESGPYQERIPVYWPFPLAL